MTRCKLKGQWTATDYAEQQSSDDEDTSFDIAARLGSQIEAAPILDRVGNSMLVYVVELERISRRTSDTTTLSLPLVRMNV